MPGVLSEKLLYTFVTDSSRSSSSLWISIYNAHLFKSTLDLLIQNGHHLYEMNRLSFLNPVASVINPVAGMNMNEDILLQYIYYLPKQLHWSVRDVLDMDYYWCEKVYNKMVKDQEEENKRRKEEQEREEAEQSRREQEMQQQYASMQHNYSSPNYNY